MEVVLQNAGKLIYVRSGGLKLELQRLIELKPIFILFITVIKELLNAQYVIISIILYICFLQLEALLNNK